MEVIAKKAYKVYICEVKHEEIEKFMNLHRYGNALNEYDVDDIIDLSAGYNFHIKTEEALKATRDLINKNKDVIQTILEGITLVSKIRKS